MPHKILICDDEEGVRESLKLILGDDYDLVLTDGGAQCLECLRNTADIDMVLLDIKMPQQNGLEVLQQVKAMRPAVKAIVITGYKSVETAAEAVRLGAAGYIVKPFRSEEILTTIKKVINN